MIEPISQLKSAAVDVTGPINNRRPNKMEDVLARVWENLVGRVGGPLTFRLILQPMMAAILAIRARVKDAREGRPPYFWAIFTDPVNRRALLQGAGKTWPKPSSSRS